jgi:hypothetical protein
MKAMPLGLMLAAILCFAVPAASADPWDAFRQFKQRFYDLDEQPFESIGCTITASNLDLEPVRQSLRPVQKNISFTETLNAFRLEYVRGRGVSFVLPALEIALVSEEGVQDKEKLKLYIEMVTQAFKSQVEEIRGLLDGVFEEYQVPRPQKVQIQAFTELAEGGATFTLTKDGRSSVNTYQGQRLRSVETGAGMTIEGQLQYTILWGKLILRQATAHIVTSEATNDVTIDFHYGSVGTVTFPSKLEVTDSNGQYRISFDKCVKK